MTTISTPVDNGVDIEFLRGAREALTAEPEGAKFTWRVTNTWVHGTHSQTTTTGYFGLGAEQHRSREHQIEGDHPELFMSEDKGATPTEVVLAALASCLTAGVATVASHREIQLRSVRATIEGDMDMRGILGIETDVRNGFGGI
jgi:organic hydroperoxide reductase OsmC/OhrA